MEATDCRRAFPSFDEPALKATFDITLVADKELTALSNMDVKEEKILESGKKATSFNTSPVMSTYLVAFIVGELSYVESNYFRVPVRVYATPGMEDRCKFSAELGARTLEFFEKKFDVPYPLPKMDMVGIHDFSAGAMENWGLVTYRVVDLLFDEENDNANTKQRVAEVVQHELAHQWFGNLVTMDWWDGLWLNEGFATWMSWYSCNSFYPDWKVWETYVGDNLQSCLALDSLRSSHPVEVPVKRADEVNQIFDAISYSKGSCIVKMVSIILGEDTFIRGISRYLKRHQYGNTETGDLWKALSEESGLDVAGIMDTWTSKVGFPVLTVSEDGNTIHVRQNRFLATGDVKPEEDTTIYPLSLALRNKSGKVENINLDKREISIDLSKYDASSAFYKLNADQAGLYRTLYPPERVVKLSQAGADNLLSVEDRVGLIADTASLSVSGYQKTSALLDLISLWKNEKEPNVWMEMLKRFGAIRKTWIFQPESTTDALKQLLGELVLPKVNELGWNFHAEESLLQQQLKGTLFSSAVSSENDKIVKEALSLFEKYASGDAKAVHPNIRAAVFGAAAKYGDEATWQRLVDVYTSPKSSVEGLAAITALGGAKNVDLQKKTIKLTLDGTVRSQDVFYVLNGLSTNVAGIQILWDWLREEWDAITKKFPANMGLLLNIIYICTGSLATPQHLKEFDEFFKSKDTKGFDKAVSISRDRLVSRIAWLERDVKDVEEWLAKHQSSTKL
ncbi:Aap1p [Sugiyamaella lignohabitans]|uniref:Aminopeptidase n=1 Tax=Sugiyamaella lignohabitans TaxID=796027 RepID=A0A167BY20_9ASCO|nr:Aap1p [Sugiyamaella lignohabitans]ANB10969.1 Aap1p [Sugiyamaella lignohabitans]